MRFAILPLLSLGTLGVLASSATAQADYPDSDQAKLVDHLLDRRTRDLTALLDDWRGSTGSAKLALEASIATLAAERSEYLSDAMWRDPAAAWDAFLSDADRTDLDSIAPGHTAQEVTLTGDLEVMVLDDSDSGVSIMSYVLEESNGTRTKLYPAGDDPGESVSGTGVTVSGRAFDGKLVYKEPIPYPQGPCSTPTKGTLDYLVVRADFANAPLPGSVTPALLNQIYNGTAEETRNAKEYFYEASFEKLTLDSTILGGDPLDLGIDAVFDPDPVLEATVSALEAQSVDLSAYDGLVIFMDWRSVLPAPNEPKFNFRNQATIGRKKVQTSSGEICLAVSYMGDRWGTFTLNLHEAGHTLGMLHSSFYKGASIQSPLTGSIVNYGDPLSIMGYNPPNAGHVNVEHKKKDLNWFGTSNFETIDTSMLPLMRVLEPITVVTTALQGIRIPRGPGDALYLEFRYALPGAKYDIPATLADTNAYTPGGENGGLMAYIRHVPSKRTLLFDPNGTSVGTSAMKAATTDSFTDPCTGVRVTAVGIDDTGEVPSMTVAIEPGEGGPCASFTPPTVAMDLPTPGSTIQGVVLLQATADDDVGVGAVRFFVGERPIGMVESPVSGTTNVFQFLWDTTDPENGADDGPATLSATAYDVPATNCCSLSTLSAPVSVTVANGGGSGPPLIAWVSPPIGEPVTIPFPLEAAASDGDGVSSVEFWCDPDFADPCGAGEQHDGIHPDDCGYHAWFPPYSHWFASVDGGRGAFLIDTDDTAPYSVQIDSLPPGSYTLWVVAYDRAGEHSVSPLIAITVDSTTALTVDLPIAADSPVPAGGSVALTANVGSEPNEVAYVDFFVGESWLARDDTAPYEATWSVPAGTGINYLLRARVSGLGGRTALDSVNVISQ